jgi:hypothetical protein
VCAIETAFSLPISNPFLIAQGVNLIVGHYNARPSWKRDKTQNGGTRLGKRNSYKFRVSIRFIGGSEEIGFDAKLRLHGGFLEDSRVRSHDNFLRALAGWNQSGRCIAVLTLKWRLKATHIGLSSHTKQCVLNHGIALKTPYKPG